ncbi:hypothetical protein [Mucilaginibacter sp.]|uniref:hypothetical protein n=1 Tax=Mucilaginibacter sp. TaxID=1882438 RepID=UPI0026314AD5|nr:hypothetical protein [Mucilaginibacter sp.]
MKKKIIFWLLLPAVMLFTYSCKKTKIESQICLHNSSIDYLKRWAVVYTQTDNYDDQGHLLKSIIVYPNGYFQINSDFTYNLFSDGVPINGKWNINENCQFVLNPNTNNERRFSVTQLSVDSLTILQSINYTKITEHYAAFTCPNYSSLEYKWDSAFTLQTSYSIDTLYQAKYTYPGGYYKFNADASYSLLTADMQTSQSGTWGIAQPGCLLVLDRNKPNETSYDVQKLTADSLTIWRKDTAARINYLQHYVRHK